MPGAEENRKNTLLSLISHLFCNMVKNRHHTRYGTGAGITAATSFAPSVFISDSFGKPKIFALPNHQDFRNIRLKGTPT
ncbi:hypothetical protein AC781_01615 [Akkermansia glycaniphila]|nr:hypothetical protein AC781_01615 [Akkermansia glycaniphila]